MKEKFLNFFTAIFLGIFSFTIFDAIAAEHKKAEKHFNTQPFDKKFSGSTFVIDGDSIKVGEKEVRLFGIDAPEYHQTCFDEKNKEYACGKASREFLNKLASKKEVVCLYSEKDKYNRFLAKCSLGEISINEELIKNGMAIIYDFKVANPAMVRLEEEAKKKKLGVWKGKFQLPKEYRKAHPRKN